MTFMKKILEFSFIQAKFEYLKGKYYFFNDNVKGRRSTGYGKKRAYDDKMSHLQFNDACVERKKRQSAFYFLFLRE